MFFEHPSVKVYSCKTQKQDFVKGPRFSSTSF